jgi:hypothetical protein
MLRCITWYSEETAPTLTPNEVEMLFVMFSEMNNAGTLCNGKYIGSSDQVYWLRLKGKN